jgi:glycosyltransferase involved in cell wall biosynthesis
MPDVPLDSQIKHTAFLTSRRRHVLMITNHGIHQWQVTPGLPDTGGQNVFVNQFTAALVELGFKITIVNRGGFPHPITGEQQRGLRYKDHHRRTLYLEDGVNEFVRKEDMAEHIPALVESLKSILNMEGRDIDLILSHYWDGAQIGVEYNRGRQQPVKHVWIPHSLGSIKKRNVSPERWTDLRIEERIALEKGLIPKLDGVVATSSTIKRALREDYGYCIPALFLPPCVDTERYHPREVSDDDDAWGFLSHRCGLPPVEVRNCRIITEISRTDVTKRKDVLIKAFAQARRRVPNSLLVLSIDENQEELANELKFLLRSLDLQVQVAVVGSIWDLLPRLYAITDIYCTPSVMEGFGMSAQEAAATRVPVVASHLVPFATEYLLGTDVADVHFQEGTPPLRVGEGAIVVQAEDVNGFAFALEMLLSDDDLRNSMGQSAYDITVPYFTWGNMVTVFLEEIGVRAWH